MKFAILTLFLVISASNCQIFDFIQKSENKVGSGNTKELSLFESLGTNRNEGKKVKHKQGPFGIFKPLPKINKKQATTQKHENSQTKHIEGSGPIKNLTPPKNGQNTQKSEANKKAETAPQNATPVPTGPTGPTGPIQSAPPANQSTPLISPSPVVVPPSVKTPTTTTPNPTQAQPSNDKPDPIIQAIDKNKQEIFDAEKNVENKINSQKKELNELENKFDEISEKTKSVKLILKENKSFDEIKQKISKNKQVWNEYSEKLNKMNNDISILNEEINKLETQLNIHSNEKHVEDKISQVPVKNAEIDNSLRVEGTLNTDNLVAEELRFGNSKISGNFVEVDNDFLISIGGVGFPIKDAIYFNNMIEKMKENCGENLNCIVSLKDEKERLEKEELMEKSLKTIKEHLDTIKK